MEYMFLRCYELSDPNLVSEFNTSEVLTMDGMFRQCTSLPSLNLSSFNTSKVTDMHDMFEQCSALTELDISNFTTPALTNNTGMFAVCSNLTKIYLNDTDTRVKLSSVKPTSADFYNK